MKTIVAIPAFLVVAPAVAAQEARLPNLFDVTGVAADDALNVRSRPSARAEIVGTLSPDAEGIEVVARDDSGGWGRVNADGRSGWASMRYLAQRADMWSEGELPSGLRCLGTEPFWSLAPGEDELVFETPEDERTLTLDAVLSPAVSRSPRRALYGSDGATRLVATIVPTQCSDGMSDRVYGLDATLVFIGNGAPRMLTGCCMISG